MVHRWMIALFLIAEGARLAVGYHELGHWVPPEVTAHNLIAPQVIREGVRERIILNLHKISGLVNIATTLKLNGTIPEAFNQKDATKPIPLDVKFNRRSLQGRGRVNKVEYVELFVRVTSSVTGEELYEKTIKMRLLAESGFVYVQTDRPIYRPQERVNIRIAAISHHEEPDTTRHLEIVIRSPQDDIPVWNESRKMGIRSTGPRFIETKFDIPEYPILGLWSIKAKYKDEVEGKWWETSFQVDRYVLPTFSVRISLKKQYILVKDGVDSVTIKGTIIATYSYGEPVNGNYHLIAKLQRPDLLYAIELFRIPDRFGRTARITMGEKDFTITIAAEKLRGATFQELIEEGATVVAEVSVTGEDEGVAETAKSATMRFVRSPYAIDVQKTSKYFVPGTTFEVKGEILDVVSMKPVSKVPFQILHGSDKIFGSSDENGQIRKTANMENEKKNKIVKIITEDPDLDETYQASVEFTIEPYTSKSDRYLVVRSLEKMTEVGSRLGIEVDHSEDPGQLRYIVASRGMIVDSGAEQAKQDSTQTSIYIRIKAEMVPSIRVFVYYSHGNEIVSNSLWVDVKNECKKEISININKQQVHPGDPVTITYTGASNAIVGISAVDRAAYFLYNGSRLTRDDLFTGYEQYDRACVREGGRDARHVFEEGGFQLVGGIYVTAKEDFSSQCSEPVKSRKKRDVSMLEGQLKMEAERYKCELDGYTPNLADESCDARKKIVQLQRTEECARVFYDACEKASKTNIGRSSGARSTAGLRKLTTARINFKENMLWEVIKLSDDGDEGSFTKPIFVTDSISNYEFDAISMDPTKGFCVAKTKSLRIFQDIFIQLHVPYSLKRMEQAQIRATIFNYNNDWSPKISFQVKLGKNLCSRFPPGEWHEVIVFDAIPPKSANSTTFVVMPLKVTDDQKAFPEEIEVAAKDNHGRNTYHDWVKKKVIIEEEGVVREKKGTHAIDLPDRGESARFNFKVEFDIPGNFIPGTRKCQLYAYSNFMGPNIEIDPVTKTLGDMKTKLLLPHGCGEQNSMGMGPLVYAYHYLVTTGKMIPGSAEANIAIEHMIAGYNNQMTRYNKDKGSWSIYENYAPSTWLNAFVNKVMAQTKKYASIPTDKICSAMQWLLQQQDPATGEFKKGGNLYSWKLASLTDGKVTLTSYVLVSLVESKDVCNNVDISSAINKAVGYLAGQENGTDMEPPYALAITSYAITISKKNPEFAKRLQTRLKESVQYSPDNYVAFWTKNKALYANAAQKLVWYMNDGIYGLSIDVEITAYALMSLIHDVSITSVTQELLDLSRKIVLWLIQQRDEKGAFRSTQDTVIALQALSKYAVWTKDLKIPSSKISIDLTLQGNARSEWYADPHSVHLDEANENSAVKVEVPDSVVSGGEINVLAEGLGEGFLAYRCTYRITSDKNENSFIVNVTVVDENKQEITSKEPPEKAIVQISISKPQGEKSGMSIVDLGLVTGFRVVESTLDQLLRTEASDGVIDRYETSVDSGRIILYLKEISNETLKLGFGIRRVITVLNPEPGEITVYDYYTPSVRTSRFYNIYTDYANLRTNEICKNDKNSEFCRCAEGGCFKCRTRQQQANCTRDKSAPGCSLKKAACESDYVYTITITRVVTDTSGVFSDFEGMIGSKIKPGSDVDVVKSDVRKFMTRTDCFQSCKDPDLNGTLHYLNEGGQYLVMGSKPEESVDRTSNTKVFTYRLDDRAIIERMIPAEKCDKWRICSNPKLTKKEKKKCKKAQDIIAICKAFEDLKVHLRDGCDSDI